MMYLLVATTYAQQPSVPVAVELNTASQAALDGLPGIGPHQSKIILQERAKGGLFKDWGDFSARVKGIGAKNSVKLSNAGLRVNGLSKPPAAHTVNDEKH
ncbi:MAG: helix-hairpin-helix domain-containing protein [Burkholderiales bacterium]|nr:helix-hairpin-helix domain-containing protein [Burkholderiales bacterium]